MTAEPERPAEAARTRLAGALKTAMKARDHGAVAVARSLLSALDNKSAVAVGDQRAQMFAALAEAPRHDATEDEVAQVFADEAAEREAAAGDYDRRGLAAEADRLRAEIAIIARLRAEEPSRGD